MGRIVFGVDTDTAAESVTLSPTAEGFTEEENMVVVAVNEERMVCWSACELPGA